MSRRIGRALFRFYLPLAIVALPMLFPLYWLAATSLKNEQEVFAIPPTWYPHAPTLDGYRGVFAHDSFLSAIRTSLFVAGTTSALSVLVAICSGYALARLKFPFRNAGGTALLFTQLFPVAAILIPVYLFWSRIGMHSSYTALILTYLAQTVPITTWLMKGYFETIPIEMEQAAWIDGATRFQAFRHVVLPLLRPAIGATAIMAFVGAWNEFIFALTLTGTDPRKKTLPVAMIDFMGQHGIEWDRLMAAATVATIPAVVLFFAAQRFFVRGLTAGAVKG